MVYQTLCTVIWSNMVHLTYQSKTLNPGRRTPTWRIRGGILRVVTCILSVLLMRCWWLFELGWTLSSWTQTHPGGQYNSKVSKISHSCSWFPAKWSTNRTPSRATIQGQGGLPQWCLAATAFGIHWKVMPHPHVDVHMNTSGRFLPWSDTTESVDWWDDSGIQEGLINES